MEKPWKHHGKPRETMENLERPWKNTEKLGEMGKNHGKTTTKEKLTGARGREWAMLG